MTLLMTDAYYARLYSHISSHNILVFTITYFNYEIDYVLYLQIRFLNLKGFGKNENIFKSKYYKICVIDVLSGLRSFLEIYNTAVKMEILFLF